MFEKLLAVLPYNPGLLHQMSFYSRRMREEALIRRTGLIFIVLTFLIQFFAVFSPPVSTVASSTNDLINGGFSSAAQAESDCQSNIQNYKNILNYYGISCDAVGSASTVTLNSHDNNRDIFSMGRLPYGSVNPSSGSVTDEEPVNIPGAGTLYVRLLDSFDTGSNKTTGSSYKALKLTNSAGVTFWLEYPCGNLAAIGPPQPPPAPAPTPPTIVPTTPQPITSTPAPTEGPPFLGLNTPSCTNINGWASENELGTSPTDAQKAKNKETVNVRIYIDGPDSVNNSGTLIYTTSNGGNGYPGTNPSWSFNIPVADQSAQHFYYIYAINQSSEYTGPDAENSGTVFGTDPISEGPCTSTPAPAPPAPTTPTPTPTTPPPTTPCPYDDTISATDSQCVVCPYNSLITISNSECKPCEQSLSSQDTLSCVSISKTAANLTQNVSDANNTTANPGDTILYTLSAQNNGKATVSGYIFQENLSDVLDYANVTDLHGGSIDSNDEVTWPAVDIPAGQTMTEQITVTVMNPVPQTPPDPADPDHFDLTMTNVYGNTINIHVPGSPALTVQSTAAALPNTGPGESIFIAAAIVVIAGYFYGRARLLSRESAIAVKTSSGA